MNWDTVLIFSLFGLPEIFLLLNQFGSSLFIVVELVSCVRLFVTPWLLCPPVSPRVCSNSCTVSVMLSNHLILCHLFLLLPLIFSSIMVFSSESALCIRGPKYWSFSFSISPSNEYSGPISFRMDWFDLLAVQGTLKGLHAYLQATHCLCSPNRLPWQRFPK